MVFLQEEILEDFYLRKIVPILPSSEGVSPSISNSTFSKGYRYPLPPIGVDSIYCIYVYIVICNVFLTTQYVPHLPL